MPKWRCRKHNDNTSLCWKVRRALKGHFIVCCTTAGTTGSNCTETHTPADPCKRNMQCRIQKNTRMHNFMQRAHRWSISLLIKNNKKTCAHKHFAWCCGAKAVCFFLQVAVNDQNMPVWLLVRILTDYFACFLVLYSLLSFIFFPSVSSPLCLPLCSVTAWVSLFQCGCYSLLILPPVSLSQFL